MPILRLAMPTPLRRPFDYLPPAGISDDDIRTLQPGIRVRAPFGRRELVGILLAVSDNSDVATDRLKAASALLDDSPILPADLLSLGLWAADYYQHPVGDALTSCLPTLLRKGEALIKLCETRWQLTTEGQGLPTGALKRAPKQAQLLALLQQQPHIGIDDLKRADISRQTLRALEQKQLIKSIEIDVDSVPDSQPPTEQALPLNREQQAAFDAVSAQQHYQCFLLEGVTGSGKTEVYLQLMDHCLQQNRQALVLIPEIGLTPQTLSRFQRRFQQPIAVLHSGLTDRERLLAWQQAASGTAGIVIGTRSAVFTPLARPGLIIVDEEHDSSFKQQEGFRYYARDIAVKRAHQQRCPVILGSATPSLETLHNALQGRYQHLQLTQRAAGAAAPHYQRLNIRHAPLQEGFSTELIDAIGNTISAGNQALVFINRRGFAPMLMCHDCGWVGQCQRCDARLTVHFQQRLLRCHHCENQQPLPHHCPDCGSGQLEFRGPGTERSERLLQQLFPTTPVIRIDRDTTARKTAMQDLLQTVNNGDPCILVGTQMLAKGHHLPDITLVGILDADSGLFSSDFRGPERMGQLLMQVSGRAGRASKPGSVLIQTHHPEHPLLIDLITQGYHQFARQLLAERKLLGLPPFSHFALIRAEANNLQQPEQFLGELRTALEQQTMPCSLLGPLPAPMAKRAGRFRAQLLIQANQRSHVHQAVQQLCRIGDEHPIGKRIRWSVDIDPVDMF